MGFLMLALALRLLLGVVAGPLLGLLLYLLGGLIILPIFPFNQVAVNTNLIVGVGLGTGIGAWLLALRAGTMHVPAWYELPAVIALAILGAWFGQSFFDDWLFKNVRGVRVNTTPEIFGAITGAIIGSMLLPVLIGSWRVAHRQEP